MPIHFAAARSTARSPLARMLARRAPGRAANDNGSGAAMTTSFDRVMRSALQQFAIHGIGAAEQARRNAERAHLAGERQEYEWWLGVCRKLDRQLAARLDRRLGIGAMIF